MIINQKKYNKSAILWFFVDKSLRKWYNLAHIFLFPFFFWLKSCLLEKEVHHSTCYHQKYCDASDHYLRSCYCTFETNFTGKLCWSKFEKYQTSSYFPEILSYWLNYTCFLRASYLFYWKTIKRNILNCCEKFCYHQYYSEKRGEDKLSIPWGDDKYCEAWKLTDYYPSLPFSIAKIGIFLEKRCYLRTKVQTTNLKEKGRSMVLKSDSVR